MDAIHLSRTKRVLSKLTVAGGAIDWLVVMLLRLCDVRRLVYVGWASKWRVIVVALIYKRDDPGLLVFASILGVH
jgi:hypothetical protein